MEKEDNTNGEENKVEEEVPVPTGEDMPVPAG
jgi:hypothetical protein